MMTLILASALGVMTPELAKAMLGNSSAPTPNTLCIAEHCTEAAAKCALNHDCRSALECTAKCPGGNQTCIFQCNSDFENDVYDALIFCMFNKNDCMETKKGYDIYQSCKPIEDVVPLATYRGAPLTKEVARKILERGTSRGDWLVAQGKSAAYDCFDCQFLYWVAKTNGEMEYIADYKIHRSNGGIRWNRANYTALEFPGSTAGGRYAVNSSNYGGLAHFEDWRLLAADESASPEWIAFYYCGSAPGVGEAYEGAFILTPDGNLPPPSVYANLTAMYASLGLQLQCKTDNSNCTGHPSAPPVF